MKISWKRVKNHLKVFVLGVAITLGLKYYMHHQRQQNIRVSPQSAENDRPNAPGRDQFLDAEKVFLGSAKLFNGNSGDALELAVEMGRELKEKLSYNPRVYCLLNGKRCVFLLKTDRLVAEEDKRMIWHHAQRLAKSQISGYPTVAVALLRQDHYGTVMVGGTSGEYLLRKEGGAFTLYPYFEGTESTLADQS